MAGEGAINSDDGEYKAGYDLESSQNEFDTSIGHFLADHSHSSKKTREKSAHLMFKWPFWTF